MFPALRQQPLRSTTVAMSPRTLTCFPCLYGSNLGLVLPLHPTQLGVMELGVERVFTGPQPLQVIRRGMAVPAASFASRSGRPWGWVTSLTYCATLRQQSARTVRGGVVGVVVGGLDCTGSKDWRVSAVATPDGHHEKDNWINWRLLLKKNHETTGCYLYSLSISGCYMGRLGVVVSLQKGIFRSPLGRGYAPRPSPRGAIENPAEDTNPDCLLRNGEQVPSTKYVGAAQPQRCDAAVGAAAPWEPRKCGAASMKCRLQ